MFICSLYKASVQTGAESSAFEKKLRAIANKRSQSQLCLLNVDNELSTGSGIDCDCLRLTLWAQWTLIRGSHTRAHTDTNTHTVSKYLLSPLRFTHSICIHLCGQNSPTITFNRSFVTTVEDAAITLLSRQSTGRKSFAFPSLRFH